jgi:hypothetical protein
VDRVFVAEELVTRDVALRGVVLRKIVGWEAVLRKVVLRAVLVSGDTAQVPFMVWQDPRNTRASRSAAARGSILIANK